MEHIHIAWLNISSYNREITLLQKETCENMSP